MEAPVLGVYLEPGAEFYHYSKPAAAFHPGGKDIGTTRMSTWRWPNSKGMRRENQSP
jgi:hypothetical protein